MSIKTIVAAVVVMGCLFSPNAAFTKTSGLPIPSFTAECNATKTHALRIGTDLNGRPLPETWGEEGPFLSRPFEKFDYVRGSGVLKLKQLGRVAPIVTINSTVLLAIDTVANSVAVSSWSYLINYKLQRVIATEVNGYGVLGAGVKARLVRLNCQFE